MIKRRMNKKGFVISLGLLLVFVVAIFLIGFILTGATSFKIGSALSSIPAWFWVLIGVILLFKLGGSGKK